MYFFLFEVFYCGTIIPIKLSIALMLIRIAQNRKGYVWSQWAMMTLFFIVDGGAMFYIIFQCSPVSYVNKDPPLAFFLAHFPGNVRGSQLIPLTGYLGMLGTRTRRDTVSQQLGWQIYTMSPPL